MIFFDGRVDHCARTQGSFPQSDRLHDVSLYIYLWWSPFKRDNLKHVVFAWWVTVACIHHFLKFIMFAILWVHNCEHFVCVLQTTHLKIKLWQSKWAFSLTFVRLNINIYIYIMTCIFQTKTVRQLLFFPPRSLWVQWKMVHSPDNWPYNGKKTTSWQCFLLWNMAIYNCHVSILEGMFQNTGRKHPFRETHEAPLNLSEQLLHGPCMPSSPSSDHPLLVLQL